MERKARVFPTIYSGALSAIARFFQGKTGMNFRAGINQGS
jgi:hypothetical protein